MSKTSDSDKAEIKSRSRKKLRNLFVKAVGTAVMNYAQNRGRQESDIVTRSFDQVQRPNRCEGGICTVGGDFSQSLKAMKKASATAKCSAAPSDRTA